MFSLQYDTVRRADPFMCGLKENVKFNIVTQNGNLASNNRLNLSFKRGKTLNRRSTEFMFDPTFNIIRLAGYRF